MFDITVPQCTHDWVVDSDSAGFDVRCVLCDFSSRLQFTSIDGLSLDS